MDKTKSRPINKVLMPEAIDAIFSRAVEQHQYITSLYRAVIPEFDKVEKLHGWPVINKDTWAYIMGKARTWDHENINAHRQRPDLEVMEGGAWFNSGFTTCGGQDLENWQVEIDPAIIEYQAEPA